jgi:hypothetical protein
MDNGYVLDFPDRTFSEGRQIDPGTDPVWPMLWITFPIKSLGYVQEVSNLKGRCWKRVNPPVSQAASDSPSPDSRFGVGPTFAAKPGVRWRRNR